MALRARTGFLDVASDGTAEYFMASKIVGIDRFIGICTMAASSLNNTHS